MDWDQAAGEIYGAPVVTWEKKIHGHEFLFWYEFLFW